MPFIFDALPGVEVPVDSISKRLADMWTDHSTDGQPTLEADDAKATQVNFVRNLCEVMAVLEGKQLGLQPKMAPSARGPKVHPSFQRRTILMGAVLDRA